MFSIKEFIILFLIFLRISSAFVSAPFFGNRMIPVISKLFIAMIISYIVFLSTDHSAIQEVPTGRMLLVFSFKEVITGLIIGFALQFVFFGVSYAGTLMGFEIGLNMAEVFNPSEEVNSNVIGEVLYYSAVLIFLLINGHHYLIRALQQSFNVIGIGMFSFPESLYQTMIKLAGSVFVIAVKIATPILVSFFLINIAEGIISRMIPNMQVFFVTQPLKIGLGLFMLGLISPVFIYMIKNLLRDYENQLYVLLTSMSS
uniref:Flagellar biosynthetic protein FliR n=1 Tax=Ignavibacterium album TaxID=591197 RepID=A0A7V3E662_9BACT